MANYRKTYLCICDGQQETMYLKHIAKLIKDFPRKVVKFNTFEDSVHRYLIMIIAMLYLKEILKFVTN